jgi:hypothetical protein
MMMKKIVMYSSLLNDVSDREWRDKMSIMRDAGIDGFSSSMQICRPAFPCVYPWTTAWGENGSSSSTYDLMSVNGAWLDHLDDVLNHACTISAMIQGDLLNEPTLRHGEMMCFGHNVQNIAAEVGMVRRDPVGAWRAVLENWLSETLPILKVHERNVAVLTVLEGTRSRGMEEFLVRFLYCDEDDGKHLVFYDDETGSGTPLVSNDVHHPLIIYSPHLHDLKTIKGYKARTYISTDGWNGETIGDIRSYVPSRRGKGDPAIESYLRGYLSQKKLGLPYAERRRPTIADLKGNYGGKMIAAFARA